jgi:hypothetical protein
MPKCVARIFLEVFDAETGMFLTKFVFQEHPRMSTIEVKYINETATRAMTKLVSRMGICLEHNLVRGPTTSLRPSVVYGHILGNGRLQRFFWNSFENGVTESEVRRIGVQVGLPYGRVVYTPLREFIVVGVVHYPELGATVRFSNP